VKNQRGTATCSAREGKQRHAARAPISPHRRARKKKREEKKSGTAKARVDEKIECDGFDSLS
jgi:hypothetical protein